MLKPTSPSRSPALHAPHQQRVAPPRRRRPWRVASPASRPCGPATPLDTTARPPRRAELDSSSSSPAASHGRGGTATRVPISTGRSEEPARVPVRPQWPVPLQYPHDRTPTVRQSTASASLVAVSVAPLRHSVLCDRHPNADASVPEEIASPRAHRIRNRSPEAASLPQCAASPASRSCGPAPPSLPPPRPHGPNAEPHILSSGPPASPARPRALHDGLNHQGSTRKTAPRRCPTTLTGPRQTSPTERLPVRPTKPRPSRSTAYRPGRLDRATAAPQPVPVYPRAPNTLAACLMWRPTSHPNPNRSPA